MKACLKENTRAVCMHQIRIELNKRLDTPPLLKRIGFHVPIENNSMPEHYFEGNRTFVIEIRSVMSTDKYGVICSYQKIMCRDFVFRLKINTKK